MKVLLQTKYIPYEEINRRWENSGFGDGKKLPKRTFSTYLRETEEMFNVTIKCDPHSGYGYYIDDLDAYKKDKNRQWLFNSFCTKDMLDESKTIPERIVYEDIPEKSEYLSLVVDAMKINAKLKITYKPYYANETAEYTIRPYCIRLYKQHWYVLGFSEQHNELRHFAINRMTNLEFTKESFVYPEDFTPESYYYFNVGIYVDQKLAPKTIKLRVYGTEVHYFRSLPLHHSQKEDFTGAEYSDFTYKLCETPDLIQEILRKGSKVEVLDPESLRTKIIDELNTMLNYYQK